MTTLPPSLKCLSIAQASPASAHRTQWEYRQIVQEMTDRTRLCNLKAIQIKVPGHLDIDRILEAMPDNLVAVDIRGCHFYRKVARGRFSTSPHLKFLGCDAGTDFFSEFPGLLHVAFGSEWSYLPSEAVETVEIGNKRYSLKLARQYKENMLLFPCSRTFWDEAVYHCCGIDPSL